MHFQSIERSQRMYDNTYYELKTELFFLETRRYL